MTAVLDIALDDVTDDAIGLVSHGHKYTFALIALYKRLLQMPIKDGERFRLLQELNSMTGHETRRRAWPWWILRPIPSSRSLTKQTRPMSGMTSEASRLLTSFRARACSAFC
jgi:hypothetical protein